MTPTDHASGSDALRSDSPTFSADTLLFVRGLSTSFFTKEGQVNAAKDITFELKRGEVLGIVGESGSGKSVTGLSIMNLIDDPGRVTEGEIWLRNPELVEQYKDQYPDAVYDDFVDLCSILKKDWNSLRGSGMSMIFQDPMSSFSPTNTVGEQIAEAVEVNRRSTIQKSGERNSTRDYGFASMITGAIFPSRRFITSDSRKRAIELLEDVGIPDPKNRATEYPHQFSGGMLQRAMIAQALAGEPDLLIADEPTTALDVTIQAQILNLLDEIQTEKDMSVLFITHNLNVLSHIADRIGVMYAGEIVERGTPSDIFEGYVHPYTEGLLGSIPDVDESAGGSGRLTPISGNVPSLLAEQMGGGCYFADRCPEAMDICLSKPPDFEMGGTHSVKCYLADDEVTEDASIDAPNSGGDGQ